MRADGMRPLEFPGAREQQVILGGQFRLPAGFDHNGLVRFDDDGRAFDPRSGLKLITGVDIGLVPFTGGKELRPQSGLWQLGTRPLHSLFATAS